MEPQKSQQTKPKPNSLEDLSPEDLAKVERARASTEGHLKVDTQWMLLTEFAMKFGWQAYLDVKADKIELPEMLTLLEASRKLDNFALYRAAQASFIGSGSAQTKKPSNTFKQLTRRIIKSVKADV